MYRTKRYVDPSGKCLFDMWFRKLDNSAVKTVKSAILKLENGHTGNVKSVGGDVSEYKITRHGGLRIYFGRDGDEFIVLLGGGNKHRQERDIAIAHESWQDYLTRL